MTWPDLESWNSSERPEMVAKDLSSAMGVSNPCDDGAGDAIVSTKATIGCVASATKEQTVPWCQMADGRWPMADGRWQMSDGSLSL